MRLMDIVESILKEWDYTDNPKFALKQVMSKIRSTYLEFTHGQFNVPMPIYVLKEKLLPIPPKEVDDAIFGYMEREQIIVYPEDSGLKIQQNPDLNKGAMDINGARKHYIKFED